MLRGIKHRHVGPDFCKNADSSKSVMDAGDSQQQFNLRKIVLSNLQNKGFEFCLMSFQRIHVATNDFELFRLLISEDTVNCFLNLCNGCFTAPIYKGSHVKLLSRVFQQLCRDGGCALTEHITEHVIKLEVGNSETILGAVLLSGHVGRKLDPVTTKISKLPDILRWNEAAANKVMLEQVGNPLSVFLVSFLPFDSLDEFRVADYHMAGLLQNVVNWEPIFTC